MIQRYGTERALACDQCGDETDRYDEADFLTMVNASKDAGWTIEQDGRGEYAHSCPSCGPGSRLERAKRMFGR
jgi:hypothetical protein